MMTKPLALAFGGAAVLVAAIAIYVQLRAQPDAPAPVADDPVAAPIERLKRLPPAGSIADGSHPKGTTTPSASDPIVTEVDGKVIRDHRTGAAPNQPVPTPRRPKQPEIASTITHEISQKVVAVLNECSRSVPKAARGPKPRAEGQLIVTVKDQQVQVTKTTVQLRDVTDDLVEPTRKCIEERTLGLTAPAKDERDVENYEISISFALL
ncbi:MAG: hypothetical protein WKG01_09775 [Kofleriaceae bacterium]